ncbi:sodium:solute symporter [Synergistales bacterium]|nr:sodium:solute symporter [Synergistales bacterium]
MLKVSIMHYIGAAFVLILITAVGIYSGRNVKTAHDFNAGGRRAGAGIVMGSIIGTLVGGASTIGTAQLAFSYGFSAWWFTLGSGLGCLALATCFSRPIYESGISTMPQIFATEYGQNASTIATLLTSLGSFLSIVSQILSGVALMTSVSGVEPFVSTIAIVALMLAYVVFGGVWGAGYVGVAKTILLYVSVGICGLVAFNMEGGLAAFRAALPASRYFNLFARGFAVDLGAGLSLLVGVLTTQSYIQALISARTLKVSRAGVLTSALLIPFIGIAGIFVGMYMKLHYPDISSASALPLFTMRYLHPLFGGFVLATLLVGVVGTGSGVALGLSSMICGDIYKIYINKNATDERSLIMSRGVIVTILVCAGLVSGGNMGSMILSWSFLSMGLRGAVAFGPLCAAIFFKGRISGEFAIAAMVAGPLFVLLGKFFLPSSIDPLFPGVAANIIVLLLARRSVLY